MLGLTPWRLSQSVAQTLPSDCPVHTAVPLPHSASSDTRKGEKLLITAAWGGGGPGLYQASSNDHSPAITCHVSICTPFIKKEQVVKKGNTIIITSKLQRY